MLSFPNVLKHFNYYRRSNLHIEHVSRFMSYNMPPLTKFDESVSNNTKILDELWKTNRRFEEISDFLFKCFSKKKDCYTFTLNLIQCVIHKNMVNSRDISFSIALAFDNWLETNNSKIPLTEEIKTKALDLVVHQRDKELLAMISKVYKFQEDSKILNEYIENLVKDGKFDEACYCVVILNLQKEIPIEKILLPLIYRQKTSFVVKYLTNHSDLQLKVVKQLDAMIGDSLQDRLPDRYLYKENKNIYKSLVSIVQAFQIPLEICPNMQDIKISSSMNFLLYKKAGNLMSEESWESMIMELVKNHPKFQKALIKRLKYQQDFNMALKMARKFNLEQDELVTSLSENTQENMNDIISGEQKIQKTFFEFLSLDTTKIPVQFIQDKEHYFNCLHNIHQNHKIIGFDAEWKFQIGFEPLRLALLQLAVKHKVYILDMLTLVDCLSAKDWDDLIDLVFANPNILKLGVGLTQDIQMLVDGFKGTQFKTIQFSHVLDMALLFERLQNLYQIELRDFLNDPPGQKSLSKLCQIILDKPLNKTERICDWEKRPLSDSQLSYAALDAHCLLQMFENLKERCDRVSFNFENAVKIAMDITTGLSKIALKSKKSYRWERQSQSFSFQPSTQVNDFKVVVENNLAPLGMKLRMFGADVTILDSSQSRKDAIQMALDENKIFLMSNGSNDKVCSNLSEDRYYILDKNMANDEKSIAQIFKKFNVHMSPNAILSRCMNCNQTEFLLIPSADLMKMYSANGTENNQGQTELFAYEDRSVSLSGKIDNGIQIQFEKIPSHIFSEVQTFKICQNCGKIHYQR